MPQDIIYHHHTNCPLKWLSMAGEMRSKRTNGEEKNVAERGRKDGAKLILLHLLRKIFFSCFAFFRAVSNVSVAPSGRVRFRQTKKRKLETFSRILLFRSAVLRNHYALFDGAALVVGL